MPNTAHTIQEV